ncbi:DUF6545 domain-containing protein [Streptomyces sp. NPDC002143]
MDCSASCGDKPLPVRPIGALRAVSLLRVLHPLWRDMVRVAPESGPQNSSALLTCLGKAVRHLSAAVDVLASVERRRVRLVRYVKQIGAGHTVLGLRAPKDLRRLARDLSRNEGHVGDQADVVAEAYWVKAALACIDPVAGGRLAASPIESGFDDDVAWWSAVSEAYRSVHPATAAALLAASEWPDKTGQGENYRR